MPNFVADSLQTPLEKDRGTFVEIDGKDYKIAGPLVTNLLSQGYLLPDNNRRDDRYPSKYYFQLKRFTDNEKIAIRSLLEAVDEAKKERGW